MANKIYFFKFLIKLNRKLSKSEILAIKKSIQRILIDTPIVNIHGGIANNNGYQKIKIDNSKGPGEIKFTSVMPSEMTGKTQIPKEDLPSFSQYSDIKDDKLEDD